MFEFCADEVAAGGFDAVDGVIWSGLDWVGLDWIGLDWIGLGRGLSMNRKIYILYLRVLETGWNQNSVLDAIDMLAIYPVHCTHIHISGYTSMQRRHLRQPRS